MARPSRSPAIRKGPRLRAAFRARPCARWRAARTHCLIPRSVKNHSFDFFHWVPSSGPAGGSETRPRSFVPAAATVLTAWRFVRPLRRPEEGTSVIACLEAARWGAVTPGWANAAPAITRGALTTSSSMTAVPIDPLLTRIREERRNEKSDTTIQAGCTRTYVPLSSKCSAPTPRALRFIPTRPQCVLG